MIIVTANPSGAPEFPEAVIRRRTENTMSKRKKGQKNKQ
jgi:hypothetical protein